MYFKRSDKGFTLIELLVVIAIIGILSTVVLASLNSARLRSRDARRVSDMKQLQIALELYFDTNRQYPVEAVEGDADTLLAGDLVPTHIAAVPTDPVGTNEYRFISSATNYCLGAPMEGTIIGGTALPFTSCNVLNLTGAGINYEVGP